MISAEMDELCPIRWKRRALSNASGTNNRLVWWPSSDIVYQQSGMRNFLRINEKTHEQKPILQTDHSVGLVPLRPVFSADKSNRRLLESTTRQYRSLDYFAGTHSETLLQPGPIFPVGWSPDGKYVYAVRAESGSKREIIRVQITAPNEITSYNYSR